MSSLRVIKLGGSLLDFEKLTPRFRTWLGLQEPATNLTLVGGGRLADAIRAAFAIHPLGEEAAHWLCIRLLGVTAELAAKLFPEAFFAKHLSELNSSPPPSRLVILDPEQFLREERCVLQQFGWGEIDALPHSWDVTSDSIAAHLAVVLRADELVLLKSRLPDQTATLALAAESGYVDRYFPKAASGLARIRCVNLRADDFEQCEFSRSAG